MDSRKSNTLKIYSLIATVFLALLAFAVAIVFFLFALTSSARAASFDLMNLDWSQTGTNVLCPQISITFRVVRSENQGQQVANFTGTNTILFPNIVASLTVAERKKLVDDIVQSLKEIYIARQQ